MTERVPEIPEVGERPLREGYYRLKLIVAYDGTGFGGWQSQPDGNTIQDQLNKAVMAVAHEPVVVQGASRTDAGVHAFGQVAHVDVRKFEPQKWMHALNGHLPDRIRVVAASKAEPGFHCRFSAKGKEYRYCIWNASYMHPLHYGRAWHLPGFLSVEKLAELAPLLEGKHDFAGFAVSRGRPEENTVRTIHALKVHAVGPMITVTVEGNGFLHKMVRLMVGSLVRVSQNREKEQWLHDLLALKKKTSFAAPANGLFLVRIRY